MQQIAVAGSQLVERRLFDGNARLLVARGALAAELQPPELEEPMRRRFALGDHNRLPRRLAMRRRGSGVCAQTARRLDPLLATHFQTGPVAELQDEVASGSAQRLVDADQHATQIRGAVDGEQPKPLGIVVRTEGVERSVECFRAQHPPLALVEDTEARIDPRSERMRAEEAMAETVDGGDPGAVELTRQVVPVRVEQPRANAPAQLAGSLLRVRDHEHGIDVEALVADGAREPLDEHLRLAGPCPGGHEHVPARLDRSPLFRVQLHARRTLHIGQRSHQVGQLPPRGSCATSPSRIRSTRSTATSRARST